MVEPASGDSPGEPTGDAQLADRSRAYRAALARYFARHGVEAAEIDDLVQDVFVRMVKRGNTDQLEQFNAYIFATAASVLTDRHRARRVRSAERHVPFDADLHSGQDFSPDRVLIDKENLRETTKVLMQLPERTRNIFVLRRLERLSHREIAVRLGVSVSAVEKHMLRATRHLLARAGELR